MANLQRKVWMEKKPCPVDLSRPEGLDMAGLADCGRHRRLGLKVVHLACEDKQTSLLLPWLSGRSHSQKMNGERTESHFSDRRKSSSGQSTRHWAIINPLPQLGFQSENTVSSQPGWLKEKKDNTDLGLSLQGKSIPYLFIS